ncbi:MAG: hypothetical protein U9R57_00710 [Thermodesulfobacteriota bacterium]|nr:hypothetical protein [Thermodesulfobacteriota bacterium]
MQLDRNMIISAQVMLLPASGKEIGPDTLVTAENIEQFDPPLDAYLIASGAFRSKGFEIGPLVGVTFSITALAGTFENVFKVELQRTVKGGIECNGGDLELPLGHLPDNTSKIIQTVTFTEPPDFDPTEFLE